MGTLNNIVMFVCNQGGHFQSSVFIVDHYNKIKSYG